MGISVDPHEPATTHSVVESSEFDVVLEKSSHVNDEGIVIAYDVAPTEDCPMAVAFMDTLPDAIGFHPDHAPHTWDTWRDDISIVHKLSPAASATFELGIVADDVHCSEEDPIFQSIKRLGHTFNAEEDVTDVDSAGFNHSIESTPFTDAKDNSPAQRDEREEVARVSTESIPGEADDVARDAPHPEKTATDNLIEVLLRELGESDESGELANRLREALAPESSRSEQIRLRHVQSKMDDLSAYTATLESFIDEFDELPRWAHTTEERLDTVEAKATEARTESKAFGDQLATLQSDIQELSASQTALTQQIELSGESIASLETSVAEITHEVDDDLSDVEERLEAIETVFSGIEEAVTAATVRGDDAQ